jgi:hypothetical chaperone protein
VEHGLGPVIYASDLISTLWPQAEQIGRTAQETLAMAGINAHEVGRVIFVGGSSLIGVIDRMMRGLFPKARFEHSAVFTAVADGLALASQKGQ